MSVTSSIFDNSRSPVTLVPKLEWLESAFVVRDPFEVGGKGGYFRHWMRSLELFEDLKACLWPGVVHSLISPCAHNVERLT